MTEHEESYEAWLLGQAKKAMESGADDLDLRTTRMVMEDPAAFTPDACLDYLTQVVEEAFSALAEPAFLAAAEDASPNLKRAGVALWLIVSHRSTVLGVMKDTVTGGADTMAEILPLLNDSMLGVFRIGFRLGQESGRASRLVED